MICIFFARNISACKCYIHAIVDALLSVAIVCGALFTCRCFSLLSAREDTTFDYFILIGYAFAISIPTVIDRSLSIYILEKIDQRGGGIKQEAFERVFTNEYMLEHRLVDVRLPNN